MTSYLDEYNPTSRSPNRRVQSDTRKLKFNNIQSCLALVLVPVTGQKMIGVHLTTKSTVSDPQEMVTAIGELQTALGGAACDAYIVANYSQFHARTGLGKAVKKIARKVLVCDVPAADAVNDSADVDVKFELSGTNVTAYVRRHAVGVKAPGATAFTPKPATGGPRVPGKPLILTDRDDKPWMPVPFQPLP